MEDYRVCSSPSESGRNGFASHQSSCHCRHAHLFVNQNWMEFVSYSPPKVAQPQPSSDQWWQRSACRRGKSCWCKGCPRPSLLSWEDSSRPPLSWIWWWCTGGQSCRGGDQGWTCYPPDPNGGALPDSPTPFSPCPPCPGWPSFGGLSCAWTVTRSKCTMPRRRGTPWSWYCRTWLGSWTVPCMPILSGVLTCRILELQFLQLSGWREMLLIEQTWDGR